MANGQLGKSLRQLRELACATTQSDAQLLYDFVHHNDQTALAALMKRHGPMVLGVCRRVLRHAPDVEDAFQAAFLVFVRRAGSIARGDSLAAWLYGVAHRVAVRLKTTLGKRNRQERPILDMPRDGSPDPEELRELQRVLDEELHGLPEKYRAPLVLHYLVGKTKAETAAHLGCTEGTVSGRLARGRKLLRRRLARRGLDAVAGLVVLESARGTPPAAVPALLAESAFAAAIRYAAGGSLVGVVSARAARLAGGWRVAAGGWRVAALVLSLALLGGGWWMLAGGWTNTPPLPPPATRHPPPSPRRPDPVAVRQADVFGDPLPANALVRLGSNRARHAGQINALGFSPDGNRLATLGRDSLVRVWSAADGKELYVLKGGPDTAGSGFWCFAFAPDGKTLATGGGDGLVRFWDPFTGKLLRQFRGIAIGVKALAFSPDGSRLAVAGEDNRLGIWDPESGRALPCAIDPGRHGTKFDIVFSPLRQVVWSPDGKVLGLLRAHMEGGAGSKPGHAKPGGIKLRLNNPYGWPEAYQSFELWEVATGRLRDRFEVQLYAATPAFAADGKALVWIDRQKNLSLRAADRGGEIRRFAQVSSGLPMTLSADGKTLALAEKGTIRLWEADMGESKRAIPDSGTVRCLAFARDGRTLAAGRHDGSYEVWDIATGEKCLPPLPGHRGYVYSAAYSLDGRILATCGQDHTIRLWQTSTGKEIRRWPAKEGPLSLTFLADGKTLVSSGGDRTVRFWETATGKELRQVSESGQARAYPIAVRLSPDGNHVAKRYAGFVRLWTAEGKEVPLAQQDAPAHPGRLGNGLTFSADGKFLAAWQRGAVRLWDTASGREMHHWEGSPGEVTALAFSPDGAALAAAGEGDAVRLWDVATGNERLKLSAPPLALPDRLDPEGSRLPDRRAGDFTALGFSRDGKTLFGGRQEEGALIVWDLAGGGPARAVPGHRENVSFLAVSRDGKSLASASADGTVLVWDVAGLTAPGP
jgi:RNA polymerase sigma factor (sigma-70 family)